MVKQKTTKHLTIFTCINLQGVAPILKTISRLYKDDRGQGLAEYGLIVALVSVAIILVMMNVGETNNNTMNKVADEMST